MEFVIKVFHKHPAVLIIIFLPSELIIELFPYNNFKFNYFYKFLMRKINSLSKKKAINYQLKFL